MGGGNANTDEGMSANLSQLKRKAQTKVKEFIHTAQAKREQVERELSIGGDGSGHQDGKHSLAFKCVRLRELVRLVRNAKTKQEERSIVAKESAAIRDAIADAKRSGVFRHRNVATVLVVPMLGDPPHLGARECVRLAGRRA